MNNSIFYPALLQRPLPTLSLFTLTENALNEISRFESIGNHAAVYTPYGKSFIQSSLAKIEQKLDPALFFKASRADIIRISAINKIEPAINEGRLLAILDDGQQVDVSRRQAQQLKLQFNAF